MNENVATAMRNSVPELIDVISLDHAWEASSDGEDEKAVRMCKSSTRILVPEREVPWVMCLAAEVTPSTEVMERYLNTRKTYPAFVLALIAKL